MPRHARRVRSAPRFEALESRTMLSGDLAMDTPVGAPDPSPGLLVRFVPGVPETSIRADLAAAGAHVVEALSNGQLWIRPDAGVDGDAVRQALAKDPEVLYAERDAAIEAQGYTPGDPSFGLQWGLDNAGNIDINATRAWARTRGSSSIIVAVLDTGIDLGNPEFAGRIWTNPAPSAGDGYAGDVHGWNFVADNADVQDDDGHGTHIAGVFGANGNNDVGGAGVDWGARIMPLKVLDSRGTGSNASMIRAIDYAVRHGARVINASWGGGAYSHAMADAIRDAGDRGVVFVTAAGNGGGNDDSTPFYPASYRLPNQIVVTAVDESGKLARFSNRGARTVDLAAPGSDILSTIPGGYAYMSGTSMATPYVTGVVSLLASLRPSYSATQLVQQVLATARPLPGLAGKTTTGGIVDAARALGLNPPRRQARGGLHASRGKWPAASVANEFTVGPPGVGLPQEDLRRVPRIASRTPMGTTRPRPTDTGSARREGRVGPARAQVGLPNSWV